MEKEIENKLKQVLKKFNFKLLKEELDKSNLSNVQQIIILKEAIKECTLSDLDDYHYESFISGCNYLIRHLLEIQSLLKEENSISNPQQVFKISEKKGAKTDIIRILNAIYELQLIEKTNKQLPAKDFFMRQMGDYLGVDLSHYDVNLSQALSNSGMEANVEVFEKMKKLTIETITKRLSQ
jgi:hypothetical protein